MKASTFGLFGTGAHPTVRKWAVWLLRLSIGSLFIASGFAKTIDIWGFVFKIEEYLSVWEMPEPRSLVLTVAIALAGAELVLGLMLATGSYRRCAVWLMIAFMTVMLPLTAYIWIKNPVSDCGCFGDMIILSNSATFWKNVLITAGLLYLALTNDKVKGLYHAYSQWILAVGAALYAGALSLTGYSIQPLLDFRSFPVGIPVITDSDDDEEDDTFEFIYEKEGHEQTFTADALPDSTWTFVDRRRLSGHDSDRTELVVYDESGENVTDEAIATEGSQIIIVVPQGERADVSYTYLINELQRTIEQQGGSLIELASFSSDDEMSAWKDLSMATYPIYSAESTVLKELSRGDMSAVMLVDGHIRWKRTLGSIDTEQVAFRSGQQAPDLSRLLNLPLHKWLLYLTLGLAGLYIIVYAIDRSTLLIKIIKKKRALKQKHKDKK